MYKLNMSRRALAAAAIALAFSVTPRRRSSRAASAA
jgi:hypothetical protein